MTDEKTDINGIAGAVAKELAKLNADTEAKIKEKENVEVKPTGEVFYCPECGTPVKGMIPYCSSCGCPLDWEA